MYKKTCVILGYGDRSERYSAYALNNPNELQVIAVIDIADYKLEKAKEVFGLKEGMLFKSLDEFLSKFGSDNLKEIKNNYEQKK